MSAAQIVQLAERFELPVSELDQLALNLAWSLDAYSRPRSVIHALTSQSEGDEIFTAALRDIRKAADLLAAARTQLRRLEMNIPLGQGRYVSTHSTIFARLIQAQVDAQISADLFAEAAKEGMCTGLREVGDKRLHRDFRRQMVCGSIIQFWSRIGRTIGYSTDPNTKERTGPLIEFINAVVACVTEPSSQLSGETIRKEILEARRFIELERAMEAAQGLDRPK